MKNFLNDNYTKKCEILHTLKDFLINLGSFNGNFVTYPHFLLLENSSLTYYVETRKDVNPPFRYDVYSLTDKAKKDVEKAILEFQSQHGYNISYNVDNYGEIQFYV